MNFKEVFERYKNGTATEEEKIYIEEEIERNELINEYLSDKIFDGVDNDDNDLYKDEIDTINVKKAVNRKFSKVIAVTIAIIIVLGLISNYVVFPIYNAMFYNPNGNLKDSFGSIGFFVDVATFTELHFPGYITNYAIAEGIGMGEYDINISQANYFSGDSIFSGKVLRNKLSKTTSNLQELNKFPFANIFDTYGGYVTDEERNEYRSAIKENIKDMPKGSIVSAYVSFNEEISINKLLELEEEYNISSAWVAVNGSEAHKSNGYSSRYPIIGFEPTGSGVVIEEGVLSKESYPSFELALEGKHGKYTSEVLESHFKSLLKYMSTREEFLNVFFDRGINYKGILEYVEENGVKTYGILVRCESEVILRFLDDDLVNNIYIDDAKFSIYER